MLYHLIVASRIVVRHFVIHRLLSWVLPGFFLLLTPLLQAQVIINEIFYHPASEDVREEYIELLNTGTGVVNLDGWRFRKGIEFTFTNAVIPAGGYLVVAADLVVFTNTHPGVSNVVGNWTGRLSNSHEDLDLDNALGNRVDSVAYADEGDWGIRQRGPLDRNHRGWLWVAEHDGGGKSLELINPSVSNKHGQNWASSVPSDGTPGAANSVLQTNIPPIILEMQHLPLVPRSLDAVIVTARLLDERGSNITASLNWRQDGGPTNFAVMPMFDDGAHEDGAANDGVFGTTIPAQANNAIVEFFVQATDMDGHMRNWPAPALDTDGAPLGQVANALYQVDDSTYSGTFPVYKLIMKDADRIELAQIGSSSWPGESESDAQMNGTFISSDGVGDVMRYTVGIRNRGHGSRNKKPNSYRVNFISDQTWKSVSGININGRYTHPQLLGSILALKSGLAGADSLPVQVRVNNANLGESNGPRTYGSVYVANEVINSDWAEHWFPDDSSGNLYRAVRDLTPSQDNRRFDWRGTNAADYATVYAKKSNASENDWSDLIAMLEVMGENRTHLFTSARARGVINVEQWMLHFAVMSLFGNGESGLNTGNNDDYFMYRGVNDPRFILMYYDLDQILGQGGSMATTADIFRATCCPISGDSEGTWRAMAFFMHQPEIELLYYRTLQQLLDTSFSEAEFNATIDQTLGDFVPASVIAGMKTWMNGRRAYVQSVLTPYLAAHPLAPVAAISGEPRSPTAQTTATLVISGEGVTQYRYALNGGVFGVPTPAATPISLSGLAHDSTNVVRVIGAGTNGVWQSESDATLSTAWVVNTSWPAVRINEVLVDNIGAFNHQGTFPDAIELFNEGSGPVNLSGLRLSDKLASPNKFTFPPGTSLASGAYLVVLANNPDGTAGFHTGFSLSRDGEGVFLFDSVARGGALLDSVEFGLQLSDLSIGRTVGGAFVLTQPTFGATNIAQPLGNPRVLRINEWLASEFVVSGTDFVELYNPDPLPVSLGGLIFTDNPIGEPYKSVLAPLTFIGGQGYREFKADGDPQQGHDHLAFKLAAEQGLIALLEPDLETIDLIAYGPQETDISQGRTPDGNVRVVRFTIPTPGAANSDLSACTITSIQLEFMDLTHAWRYNQTQNLDGVNWVDPAYDDSSWPSGGGLLAYESSSVIVPLIQTTLTDPRTPPAGLTSGHAYYFRTSFVLSDDLTGFTVTANAYIDDGAIIYINGSELPSRVRMPGGSVVNSTPASGSPPYGSNGSDAEAPDLITIPAFYLVPGTNVIAVEVHQSSTTSSDIVWGMSLGGSMQTTNCGRSGVVLNEVLANNQSFTNTAGRSPDWIEIVNTTTNTVDLGDMSLSDTPGIPRKWVFPSSTSLLPGERITVESDADLPPGTNNTGFSLGAGGDVVYLYDSLAGGGGMVDSIRFGLQPVDFSIGRIPDALGTWALALPTRNTANVAAGLGNPSGVRINEWMANPASGNDWFELYNPDAQPVAVNGLTLSDDPSNRDKSPLPSLSFLAPTGYQKLIADNDPNQGADHVAFRLGESGDFIGLYWPIGTQVDALSFAAQAAAVSQGRFPNGAASVVPFPRTASPGAANYLPLANLVINEVLSHTDAPLEDAVEIRNLSPNPVDIGGWYLSNTGENPQKFLVASNTILAANGFKVFYEYQFATNTAPGVLTPFSFNSAHGDEVHLSQTDGGGNLTGYRAAAKFGASANGISFGRFLTSVGEEFVAMNAHSFGVANPASLAQFRTGTGAPNSDPLVGPVIFSEIHFLPTNSYASNNSAGEFIELRNFTPQAVPLYDPGAPTNTWRIAGGVDFDFPMNVTLPATGSVVVVSFDPATDVAQSNWFRAECQLPMTSAVLGPWSGSLANEGETLELYRPDPPQLPPQPDAGFVPQVLVERVSYRPVAPWPTNGIGTGASLQRRVPEGFGNEPFHWFAAAPSAGFDNLTDSDGDGLPDYWEIENGLSPTNAAGINGATGNLDGDPHTNIQEWRTGTFANDSNDYLQITSVAATAGGVVIRFRASGGRSHAVLFSATPNGPWQTLVDAPVSGNAVDVEILDPAVLGSFARYYQIVTPAQDFP